MHNIVLLKIHSKRQYLPNDKHVFWNSNVQFYFIYLLCKYSIVRQSVWFNRSDGQLVSRTECSVNGASLSPHECIFFSVVQGYCTAAFYDAFTGPTKFIVCVQLQHLRAVTQSALQHSQSSNTVRAATQYAPVRAATQSAQ